MLVVVRFNALVVGSAGSGDSVTGSTYVFQNRHTDSSEDRGLRRRAIARSLAICFLIDTGLSRRQVLRRHGRGR